MSDISITAANVDEGTEIGKETGVAGATITAGQSLYLGSNGKLLLADADTESKAVCRGIALHGASEDQPITYKRAGTLDMGATLVRGTVYVVSTTAGGIAPWADLSSGDYVTILGIATTTAILTINIQVSGIAI